MRYVDGAGYVCDSSQEEDDMFNGPVTLHMLAWVRFNKPGELPQITSVRIFSEASPTSRLSHGVWLPLGQASAHSWESATDKLEAMLSCHFPRLAHLYGAKDESVL